MKLAALATALAACAVVSLPAKASEDLAKKYMCMTCHTVDKKLVGPAYKEVAAKYASDKAAEGKLTEKIKKGGVGVWGQIPMPPNAAVSQGDINELVTWILQLKK